MIHEPTRYADELTMFTLVEQIWKFWQRLTEVTAERDRAIAERDEWRARAEVRRE